MKILIALALTLSSFSAFSCDLSTASNRATAATVNKVEAAAKDVENKPASRTIRTENGGG